MALCLFQKIAYFILWICFLCTALFSYVAHAESPIPERGAVPYMGSFKMVFQTHKLSADSSWAIKDDAEQEKDREALQKEILLYLKRTLPKTYKAVREGVFDDPEIHPEVIKAADEYGQMRGNKRGFVFTAMEDVYELRVDTSGQVYAKVLGFLVFKRPGSERDYSSETLTWEVLLSLRSDGAYQLKNLQLRSVPQDLMLRVAQMGVVRFTFNPEPQRVIKK